MYRATNLSFFKQFIGGYCHNWEYFFYQRHLVSSFKKKNSKETFSECFLPTVHMYPYLHF